MAEYRINEQNFESEVLRSSVPVLLDFFATWCGPCRMISPILEELSEKYDGKLKVCKVDVDEAQELAIRFRVDSIPTVLFFKSGEVADKFTGYRAKNQIEEILQKIL